MVAVRLERALRDWCAENDVEIVADTVEFGLGSTAYPIDLTSSSRYTEEQLAAGPTFARPVPKL